MGILYKSPRELKVFGVLILLMGLAAGFLIVRFAWILDEGQVPLGGEPIARYGRNLLLCLIDVTVSASLALIICALADMLDCLRGIRKNTNEICAALKSGAEAKETLNE